MMTDWILLGVIAILCVTILAQALWRRSSPPITAPIPIQRPVVARVPANRRVTDPPMVDGVTLYKYLSSMHPLKDGVWAAVVHEFYTRAAGVPEIAVYFRNTDLETLQRHFTRTLVIITDKGLTEGMLRAMAEKHGPIRDNVGRPITFEVYDAVIGTLVDILSEQKVPDQGIKALAITIAPLREIIAQ